MAEQVLDMTQTKTASAETPAFGHYAPTWFHQKILRITKSRPDSWLGRRMAFIFRRFALLTLNGPLDVKLFGHDLRLYPFRNVSERRALFTPQYFDERERTLIAERLPENPVFVDIGANVGLYSFFVAGQAKGQATILAIEPQTDILDRLKTNIGFNAQTGIKPLDCAVGSENGEMTLFIDPGNQGESSVKMIGDGGSETAIRVPTKTLLTILDEEGIDHIDGLKIDVEGAEDIILFPFFENAPTSLHPGVVVLERSDDAWHDDCRQLLTSHGYALIAETRLNLVFEKT